MSAKHHRASHYTVGDDDNRRLVAPFDKLNGSELATLRWLLWRMHPETGLCIPSDDDVAIGTGLALSTVQRARGRLRKKGLIDWTPRYVAGKRSSNSYRLTVKLTSRLRELEAKVATLDPPQADGQFDSGHSVKLTEERGKVNVGATEDVCVQVNVGATGLREDLIQYDAEVWA